MYVAEWGGKFKLANKRRQIHHLVQGSRLQELVCVFALAIFVSLEQVQRRARCHEGKPASYTIK